MSSLATTCQVQFTSLLWAMAYAALSLVWQDTRPSLHPLFALGSWLHLHRHTSPSLRHIPIRGGLGDTSVGSHLHSFSSSLLWRCAFFHGVPLSWSWVSARQTLLVIAFLHVRVRDARGGVVHVFTLCVDFWWCACYFRYTRLIYLIIALLSCTHYFSSRTHDLGFRSSPRVLFS